MSIVNMVIENLQNPNAVGIETLTDKVRAANKLFEKGTSLRIYTRLRVHGCLSFCFAVKGPQEATLDSAFLVTASTLGAAKARQMRSDSSGFDIDDFIAKLVTFMGGRRQGDGRGRDDADPEEDDELMEDEERPLEWDKIGRKALAKSRRVPTIDFMYVLCAVKSIWFLVMLVCRLGPLSIETKKRNITKRAKLNKEAEEEKKPQEVRS